MERQKRSFEFRMSKKVAELTQVVHMLFTRNHEKEVEIETLKDAYEAEVRTVILDAKKRINSLQAELEEAKSKSDGETDQVRILLEQEFKTNEAELLKKLEAVEKLLADERTECQNLRDMLINAQKDIEQLRQGVAEQLSLKSDEIVKRDREIERLKKQNALLEKAIKDSEKETTSAVRDFEKSNDKLQSELTHVHEVLEDSHRIKDQLQSKVKGLETELKTLKRDFQRRVSEAVASQIGKMPRSAPSLTTYNEELERLRREVQRYRLELSNRDLNFNRMFTPQQPVVVDPRTAKSGPQNSPQPGKAALSSAVTQSNPVLHNGIGQQVLVNGFTKTSSRVMRNPAVPHVPKKRPSFSSVHTFVEELSSPRPISASSQLPSLSSSSSADARSGPQRFTKPKPLPKEMLFTK